MRALQHAQPFWLIDALSSARGSPPPSDYASHYERDELRRLRELSNLDKHRELVVFAWSHALTYWPSGDATNRRWHQSARRLIDGGILGYMRGSDPDVRDALFREFDLVIEDDVIADAKDPMSTVMTS